jgi:type IV fimbrial biogenesis protein FimT
MTPCAMKHTRHLGFTLVELMVTIAVLIILLMVAVPSFQRTIDNRRIIGAADNILADLRYAQSESIKRNVQIPVVFTEGANWSYNVNTDPVRSTSGADYRGTSIVVATTGDTLTFDPRRGTLQEAPVATQALITITSAMNSVLAVQVDPLSHMSLCTTTGTGGYPSCN